MAVIKKGGAETGDWCVCVCACTHAQSSLLVGQTVETSVFIHSVLVNSVCLVETPFSVSPELTEVLSEHLQSPLQKVLDGIALLHLQAKQTNKQKQNENRQL